MQMNLGSSQYLFTVVVNPSEMPCLCLRYDVDAIVLQPHPEQPENTWEHIATFNALGTCLNDKHITIYCDVIILFFFFNSANCDFVCSWKRIEGGGKTAHKADFNTENTVLIVEPGYNKTYLEVGWWPFFCSVLLLINVSINTYVICLDLH